MAKFKVGDRVRRLYAHHIAPMKIGTEWIVSKTARDGFYVLGFEHVCSPKCFELVEVADPVVQPSNSTSYPCIKHIPAQAARTEIVTGKLTDL